VVDFGKSIYVIIGGICEHRKKYACYDTNAENGNLNRLTETQFNENKTSTDIEYVSEGTKEKAYTELKLTNIFVIKTTEPTGH
jgi:hypothetical protein